jgi:hypothetical protein
MVRCAQHLQDSRVNHVVGPSATIEDIQLLVEKLETGAIFGIERYLPAEVDVKFRRLTSFEKRRKVLDEVDAYLEKRRFRPRLRRSAIAVAEELLMNAMYQAPVDDRGQRVFDEVDPANRPNQDSPRPASIRFCSYGKAFYLCVRDRYGSFDRRDLSAHLRRCATSEQQIQDKRSGAGLGLFLIVSRVFRFIINVLPGRVSEFICTFSADAPPESCAQVISVTTQRRELS